MKYLMFILLNSQIPYLSDVIRGIISECTGSSGKGEIAFFSSLETYQSFSLALLTLYIAFYLLGIPFYSRFTSMFERVRYLNEVELKLKKALTKKDELDRELRPKTGLLQFTISIDIERFWRRVRTKILTPVLIGLSILICYDLLSDFFASATLAHDEITNIHEFFENNNAIENYLYLIIYCSHLMVFMFKVHCIIVIIASVILIFYFIPKAINDFHSIPNYTVGKEEQLKYVLAEIEKLEHEKENVDDLKNSAKTPSQTSSVTTLVGDLGKSRKADADEGGKISD